MNSTLQKKCKMALFILGTLLLILSSSTYIQAQVNKPREWGEINGIDRFQIKVADDTAASAIVLFDKANYYADIQKGLTIIRHKRIKILKENGKSWGDFKYKYYSKDGYNRVASIKAQTININEDGGDESIPVPSSSIYRTEVDKDYSRISFAFPAVKVGSILEYEIEVTSKNLFFPSSWYFQTFIPTLYSEMKFVQGPEFQYHYLQYGTQLCQKYAKGGDMKWVLENLPALIDDEYVPSPYDYSERVSLQLQKCAYPISELGTWRNVTFKLLNDYKDYLKVNDDIKVYASNLVGLSGDTLEVIKKLFKDVSSRYSWNNDYDMFPEQSRKFFMSKMSGNSAEKNLFLIGLLRSVGLEADPVILSTKDNGVIFKDTPMLEQYNHVVAVITYRGKPLILDAASHNLPYNLVDQNTLGCSGYRLNKKLGGWLVIEPQTRSAIDVHNDVNFGKDKLVGKVKIIYTGYTALEERKRYNNMKISEYEARVGSKTNLSIDSICVENASKVDEDLFVTINYSSPLSNEKLINLSSIMMAPYAKNPFVMQDREMPVTLPFPLEYSYNSVVRLPQGYKVDGGMQDSKHGISANDTFTLLSTYNPDQNSVEVACRLNLKTTTYLPDRYPVLRNFFENIVDKSSRMITLIKNP